MVSRSRSAGVARREFSLASKVLRWLLPYRVPAYNSYVCQTLRICGAADHSEAAYRKVAHEILGATRTITNDGSWLGVLEPHSPVRALVDIEGQQVPEMFCLVTDLLDWEEYPAFELAALYRWRWDGSDCATRRCRYGWR